MQHDIHSLANPAEAIMKHLTLDIMVDFEKKQISGTAEIQIETRADAKQLVLDTKDLLIENVLVNGQQTHFYLKEALPYLGQALVIELPSHASVVQVTYQTSPSAAALQWLEPQQTFDKIQPFLFTQSQAILARTWIPCQDSPGIRFTYQAQVKVPAALMAVMSAENPVKKNPEGLYHFNMPQPIPAYLLALAVGDFVFEEIGTQTGIYAEKGMLQKSVYEFADMQKMLEAAEAIYGKYEWGRYDMIVLPPSFPFGGMENPRLTFCTPTVIAGDRSLTSLVAHELAHSWSGNLVTNATWNDFWLNEGFTVYFERRIMESLYGKDYADMLAFLGYQDLEKTVERLGEEHPDTMLQLDLKGRDPDEGVSDIAYEKGYFFLRKIEEKVGREKFDLFVKKYFQDYSFQSMDTASFVNYLEKELPQALPFVQPWIYSAGLPDDMTQKKPERFIQTEHILLGWLEGRGIDKSKVEKWTSHEWLNFLRNLPDELSLAQLKELDGLFQFSHTGNAEILCEWLIKVLPLEYEEGFEAAKVFLNHVGRRKFLMSVYRALLMTEKGKKIAAEVYRESRGNYHSVASKSLDELLGFVMER